MEIALQSSATSIQSSLKSALNQFYGITISVGDIEITNGVALVMSLILWSPE